MYLFCAQDQKVNFIELTEHHSYAEVYLKENILRSDKVTRSDFKLRTSSEENFE